MIYIFSDICTKKLRTIKTKTMLPMTLDLHNYEEIRLLGRGARSVVWQARSLDSDKIYAIKRFRPNGNVAGHKLFRQAQTEYETASVVSHQGIRKVFDLKRVRGFGFTKEIYLVMEYCDGQTLQNNGSVTIDEGLRLFRECASALSCLHRSGFVHADLTPSNIVVNSQTGHAKMIDLGQSCLIGTVKNRIQGTPDFIAPEQTRRSPITTQTDIFNLGATMYWALTGRPVPTFQPRVHGHPLVAHLSVIPPRSLNTDIPDTLNDLLLACIQVDPSKRPESMAEIITRIEAIDCSPSRFKEGDK